MSTDEYLFEDGYVKVYVDGCCLNNGLSHPAAGYGIVFNLKHPDNLSNPIKVRKEITNTAAEAQAAEKAIDIAGKKSIEKLIIVTDSQMLADFEKNRFKWEQKEWKNADLEAVDQKMTEYSDMDIKFKHVRGHDTDQYNKEADRLARAGARLFAQPNY